jgi:transposase
MSEQQFEVQIEPVEDIPVLIAKLERMNVQKLIGRHFMPHGNWRGCQVGQVVQVWLTYVLTEGDHRLSHLQEWVKGREKILSACLKTDIRAEDFSDDRLEIVLDLLGQDENWQLFDCDLTQGIVRVYDLKGNLIRLDSTSGSGYWEVNQGGLFQYGHSKDHRPDLPQFKVMLATLDQLGLAVGIQVPSGEKADDPLYIPAIDQVRQNLGRSGGGLFFVGDCKIMAFETRLHAAAGGDCYLGPFSKTQIDDEALTALLKPFWDGEKLLEVIQRKGADIAEGFETSVELSGTRDGKEVKWTERRLVVRSYQHAHAATQALEARLSAAANDLGKLNERGRGKEHYRDTGSLTHAAQAVLQKHKVEGCFRFTCEEQTTEYQVRAYKERPSEIRSEHEVTLRFERDEPAIQELARLFGWRVYGTNQPKADFSLEQLVCAYRNEYLVERNFGRLKGKSLALTPMYLQDDNRATGLIRLLSIALRALTLLEHVLRENLVKTGQKLAGVYAGNPKRETATPKAETILRAFMNIYLTTIQVAGQTHQQITPLNDVQRQILALCELPANLYDLFSPNLQNPYPK